MRKILKYSIFTLILSFSLCFNVNAECSYEERKQLLEEAKNVEIKTEIKTIKETNTIVNEDGTTTEEEIERDVIYFYITNITENIFIRYYNLFTEGEMYINDSNLVDGIYSFYDRDTINFYTYHFEIYSRNINCEGKDIYTKKIKKPATNRFSGYSVCEEEGMENFKYCNKYITEDITLTSEEFEKLAEKYLKKNEIPEEGSENKKTINKKIVIIGSLGLVSIITIIIALIMINKKRNDL